MRVIKVFLVLIVTLAVIAGLFWQFFLKDEVRRGQIGAAYTAKQYCSCRFVGERPASLCRANFTEDVSAITFREEGDTVHATALWGLIGATAIHTEGFGCTLQ
jgi:hypothetical protein